MFRILSVHLQLNLHFPPVSHLPALFRGTGHTEKWFDTTFHILILIFTLALNSFTVLCSRTIVDKGQS